MSNNDDFAAGRSAERVPSRATEALHERSSCCATAVLREREDILAYLGRRHANAATMAGHKPELCEFAEDRRRQLDAVIDEIEGGLHQGEAEVAATVAGEKARA